MLSELLYSFPQASKIEPSATATSDMNSDFLNAHTRHWTDAEHLFQLQRWANADHLYGLAAECGLKRLMLEFGMGFDIAKDRPSASADQVHVDKVWVRYETYRSGHPQGAGYTLPTVNPFSQWRVSDRYANESNFNRGRAQVHQAGAQEVCKLIAQAKLNGLI